MLLFLDEPTSGLDRCAAACSGCLVDDCFCGCADRLLLKRRPPLVLSERSVTALMLTEKLRTLADDKACTVVSTIHQPQAQIFKCARGPRSWLYRPTTPLPSTSSRKPSSCKMPPRES